MPSSLTLSYECPLCKAVFDVTVSDLTDPSAQSTADAHSNVLDALARSVLQFATCPACKAKNPEGVAADRHESRAMRLVGSALFASIAVASYFAPRVSLLLPLLWFGLFVLQLATFARGTQPRLAASQWLRVVINGAFPPGVAAAILALPRFAFAVPLLYAVWFVVVPSDGEARFARAAERMRFTPAPRRGSIGPQGPALEQPAHSPEA